MTPETTRIKVTLSIVVPLHLEILLKTLSDHSAETLHQRYDCRNDGDDKDAGENEENQRDYELDCRLGRKFLGSLSSLRTQGIGESSQRL